MYGHSVSVSGPPTPMGRYGYSHNTPRSPGNMNILGSPLAARVSPLGASAIALPGLGASVVTSPHHVGASVSVTQPQFPSGNGGLAPPPSADDLDVGDVTVVGGQEYRIVKQLGQGAFGKAWLVRLNQGAPKKEYVLKVVSASDRVTMDAAVFEVQVLQHLTKSLPKNIRDTGRVPLYGGHYISEAVLGKKCVVCVMTRVWGVSLDKWLYGVDEEVHKTIEPDTLIHGPLKGGQMKTMSAMGAYSVASSILTNLCQVLSTLQPFAFHRDISSHNVLVNDMSDDPKQGPDLHVSLIDFGCATSTRTWAPGSWKTNNISGDPRYWTPAAWMNFAHGCKYLDNHPNQGLVRQYKERLDHFCMGILILEVFFALWNESEDNEVGSEIGDELTALHAAWCTYWKVMLETFQQFHSTDPVKLRKTMAKNGSIDEIDQTLHELLTALQDFSENVNSNHPLACLFSVCADLLDEWGTYSWTKVAIQIQKEQRADSFDSNEAVEDEDVSTTKKLRKKPTSGACDLSSPEAFVRGRKKKGDCGNPEETCAIL